MSCELMRSTSLPMRRGRLVLLGPAGSGKTALQRGLRSGAPPPLSVPPLPTPYCELAELCLGEGEAQVALTLCDLSGAASCVDALTPYLTHGPLYGSLYLLCVAAHTVPVVRPSGCAAANVRRRRSRGALAGETTRVGSSESLSDVL